MDHTEPSLLRNLLRNAFRNQLGRRNLTDEQRAYVQGKLYGLTKKNPKGFKDRDLSEGKNCLGDKSNATAKQLGAIYGSSERKIRYAYDFAQAIDKVREEKPEAAEKILRGEVKDALTALPQFVKKEDPESVGKAKPHRQKS